MSYPFKLTGRKKKTNTQVQNFRQGLAGANNAVLGIVDLQVILEKKMEALP